MFGDGAGQISSLRVLSAVVVGAVVVTKFYNAWLTRSAVVWDAQDLGLIGSVLGAKLVQNFQEQSGAATSPSSTPSANANS